MRWFSTVFPWSYKQLCCKRWKFGTMPPVIGLPRGASAALHAKSPSAGRRELTKKPHPILHSFGSWLAGVVVVDWPSALLMVWSVYIFWCPDVVFDACSETMCAEAQRKQTHASFFTIHAKWRRPPCLAVIRIPRSFSGKLFVRACFRVGQFCPRVSNRDSEQCQWRVIRPMYCTTYCKTE